MKLLGVTVANIHNICLKMNDICIPSYCMNAVHLAEQNIGQPRKRWTDRTSLEWLIPCCCCWWWIILCVTWRQLQCAMWCLSNQQLPPCSHMSPPHLVPSQSAMLRAAKILSRSSAVRRQFSDTCRTQPLNGIGNPETEPIGSSDKSGIPPATYDSCPVTQFIYFVMRNTN